MRSDDEEVNAAVSTHGCRSRKSVYQSDLEHKVLIQTVDVETVMLPLTKRV